MKPMFETHYMGFWIKVFPNRVEFKSGAGIKNIPISQIASIEFGMVGLWRIVLETTGGKRYKIPCHKKKEVKEAIYKAQEAWYRTLGNSSDVSAADELVRLKKEEILSKKQFEEQKNLIEGEEEQPEGEVESKKKKSKIIMFVIIGFIVLSVIGNLFLSSTPTEDFSTKPTQAENQISTLTHDNLLKIAKESPSNVIGETYNMTLYLEQNTTRTDAYFMSQNEPNSFDTILLLCYMSPNDLSKLDGASAQQGNYKSYNLQVSFSKYDSQAGMTYEARCILR